MRKRRLWPSWQSRPRSHMVQGGNNGLCSCPGLERAGSYLKRSRLQAARKSPLREGSLVRDRLAPRAERRCADGTRLNHFQSREMLIGGSRGRTPLYHTNHELVRSAFEVIRCCDMRRVFYGELKAQKQKRPMAFPAPEEADPS